MELILLDLDRAKLLRGDLLASGVAPAVDLRSDHEAAAVRRVRDQVDDGLERAQRSTAPVDRNEREQPVLDLVPLARARREMADTDGDSADFTTPIRGLYQASSATHGGGGVTGIPALQVVRKLKKVL